MYIRKEKTALFRRKNAEHLACMCWNANFFTHFWVRSFPILEDSSISKKGISELLVWRELLAGLGRLCCKRECVFSALFRHLFEYNWTALPGVETKGNPAGEVTITSRIVRPLYVAPYCRRTDVCYTWTSLPVISGSHSYNLHFAMLALILECSPWLGWGKSKDFSETEAECLNTQQSLTIYKPT